jgi:hypothetical protein
MTTADIVLDRALALAASDMDTEDAISELKESCGGRRVAVVMARRHLLESSNGGTDERAGRAAMLLDELLVRLSDV